MAIKKISENYKTMPKDFWNYNINPITGYTTNRYDRGLIEKSKITNNTFNIPHNI